MKRMQIIGFGMVALVILTLGTRHALAAWQNQPKPAAPPGATAANEVPILEFDPTWPKRPLPNQ